jgi:hypothetical protein
MATSTGKIGRLPTNTRLALNSMIRDNKSAETIIRFLEHQGVKGITPMNISNWKNFGYQEWLRRTERLDEIASRREFAMEVAKGDFGSDGVSALATDLISETLEHFDPRLLQDKLAEKPQLVIELVHALSSIRQRDQASVLLRQKVDAYRRSVEKLSALVDQKGTATKADVDQIFKEAYGV